jgi:hypothetical protein
VGSTRRRTFRPDRAARTWSFELSKRTAPMSSNAKPHWAKRMTEHRDIRWDARVSTINAVGHAHGLQAIELAIVAHPPNRQKRDSDNLVDHLVKPVKDGVAEALRLTDDTDDVVDWKRPRIGHPTNIRGRWRYVVTITEVL